MQNLTGTKMAKYYERQKIHCVEYSDANLETRAFYDKATERLDVLLNAVKIFGHHHEYGHVFIETLLTILKDGVLPWKVKELLILKTTLENDCAYCVVQHERIANMLSIPSHKITDLQGTRYRTSSHFTEAERSLLDFCLEIIQDANAVSAGTWSGIRQHWSDSEIVDAAFVTSFYVAVSKFITSLDVKLEPEIASTQPLLRKAS
jgi:AhpD family alkylhydroperoxidase